MKILACPATSATRNLETEANRPVRPSDAWPEPYSDPHTFDPDVLLRESLSLIPDYYNAAPDDNGAPAEVAPFDDRPHDADGPRFSFEELIDQEALGFKAWGTPVGDFLSREMEKLAQMVRWTQSTTPADHEDRMAVWDDEIRQQWEARGYEAGRSVGCHCKDCLMD